jgi:cell division protease FtsH
MYYIVLFNLIFATSFRIQNRIQNRIIRFNYNDDKQFKRKLSDVDSKINVHKIKMRELLIEKNRILKNITGLNFHNETQIDNYLNNGFNKINNNEENEENEDDEEDRYNMYFIKKKQDKKENINSMKSENFEIIYNSDYNFSNVGGYEVIKEELMQCADMLVNYTKYAEYNVRVPKGIILEGPPGNGKTLLAKCFSGEIEIGFIPVSGAQFQEKYVGVGASRIRELFKLASDNVPCIIFIDELDALGRTRSSDQSNANSEHDSTLNELLVNLDGFKSVNGIFIIGATNRIDLLDKALIRPGRIDKKIYVSNPNKKTREYIINIHRQGKPIDNKVMIDYLIEITNGFSGAQIENLLNEAMLYVLRQNRNLITKEDLNLITNRILVGFQSTENNLSDDIIYQVAVHEIGHALIGLMTKQKKLIKITINLFSPKTLGFTLFEPNEEFYNIQTKEQLINEIMILLGGRIAEEIIFGNKNISSGASHDLEQVKKIAHHMVINLGMGEKIIINDQVEIIKEIDKIISMAFDKTRILLSNVEPLIKDCANLLVINYELQPKTIINLINNKYPYINKL